jgi:hypothetical protein
MLVPVRWLRFLAMVALLALVELSGCGGSSGNGINPPLLGKVYVSNGDTSSVMRFGAGDNGNVSPQAKFTNTVQMQRPSNLAADVLNDRLYVICRGNASIAALNSASTRSSATPGPDRLISGAATTLVSPTGIALDTGKDLLYVADGNNVLVFAPASTVNGNVAPVRTLNLGSAGFTIALDSASDRLFAAAVNAVNVYDSASTLSGAATANRVITGASTQLQSIHSIVLDSAGRLIVSNFFPENILVFANAATANGNVAPVATITGVGVPLQINLSSAGDLYVANNAFNAAVIVIGNIASANGSITPVRTLAGPNTGLDPLLGSPSAVSGIAVDSTH